MQLDYQLETDLRGDLEAGAKQRDEDPPGLLRLRHRARQGHRGELRGVVRRRRRLAQRDPWPRVPTAGGAARSSRTKAGVVRLGPRLARRRTAATASSRRSSGPTACDEAIRDPRRVAGPGLISGPAWHREAHTLPAAARDGGEGCRCWKNWGSSPDVELVYRALLGRPSTSVPRSLAEGARAGRSARGREGTGGPPGRRPGWLAATTRRTSPRPPAVALGALITERRDGLRLAEQALVSLAEEHRAAVAGRRASVTRSRWCPGSTRSSIASARCSRRGQPRAPAVRHGAVRRGADGGEHRRDGRRRPRHPDPRGHRAGRARRARRDRGVDRLDPRRHGAAGGREAAR